jgi:hypothetical protein
MAVATHTTNIAVPTPRQWWAAIPDAQRATWRTAAERGVLPPSLAEAMEAGGIVVARAGGIAFFPPQFADEVLAP